MTISRTHTRLEPAARREQILAAAEAVLADEDPTTVTFEQVAEAAGVSRALVYNYFGDRIGLLAALYLRGTRAVDNALIAVAASGASPAEQAQAVVDVFVDAARRRGTMWRVLYGVGAGSHPAMIAARRQRFDRLAAEWDGPGRGREDRRAPLHALVALMEAATVEALDRGRDPSYGAPALVRLLTVACTPDPAVTPSG